MQFGIKLQESYSRGQLLLRTFFGFIYILIPHMFVLYFINIGYAITSFVALIAILFTGKYPKGLFNFHLNVNRWLLRVQARMLNMADGYPAFGLSAIDENTKIELEYPESVSRLSMLLRVFFGFIYVLIPHAFILVFLLLGMQLTMFIAFFAVLFTAKFPKGLHTFYQGVLRWQFRVNIYMLCMSNTYPPFSLKGDEAIFGKNNVSNNPDVIDQF